MRGGATNECPRSSRWSPGWAASSLALGMQGMLPFIEPAIAHRQGDAGRAHRSRRAEMDGERRDRLHRIEKHRPQRLYPRGLLVLPFAVRAAGDRRDAALGAGQPGRRICLRRAASVLHPPHRAGPDARRAQILRRVASRAFLEPAHAGAGLRSCRASSACSTRRTRRCTIIDDANGNRTLEKTPSRERFFDFGRQEQVDA